MSSDRGIGPIQTQAQEDVTLDGITIAPGVVETVVALAAEQTEGVAGVCARSSIRRMGSAPAVDVALEDGELTCAVHIVAYYGYLLPELGHSVQSAVRCALDGQMGIKPASVDVFIDGIEFED
ncbi:MAG: Asp23/Gls24 family envelope stress response protein [Coriobacteriia bacterium]|nr:Asp23/Gls24 family envelope stress response protein [Coriobacteriia bacterium]